MDIPFLPIFFIKKNRLCPIWFFINDRNIHFKKGLLLKFHSLTRIGIENDRQKYIQTNRQVK